MTGSLVLVATPIGNLGDLSPRAVEVLRTADLVCCEDTRHSGKLLAHAGIRAARLAVVNDHTEQARTAEVLDLLAGGAMVAIVTDAGTPGISDPGSRLVDAAHNAGAVVSAVPGPAAFVMALVVSGLDTTRFVFEGFLPRSGRDRSARLADIAGQVRTSVLYEAPHRIARTIADLETACGGDRRVAVCRELTKLHEQVWRGTLAEATAHPSVTAERGEYVVVIAGAPPRGELDDDELVAELRRHLAAGTDKRTAIAQVASDTQVAKRRVYQLALGLT